MGALEGTGFPSGHGCSTWPPHAPLRTWLLLRFFLGVVWVLSAPLPPVGLVARSVVNPYVPGPPGALAVQPALAAALDIPGSKEKRRKKKDSTPAP